MSGTDSTFDPILFDTEAYDYGDNYNPATGLYTVPYNGTYLIHARVTGNPYWARHIIRVDGVMVTYTTRHDPVYQYQHGSTSVTLHLVEGQEVAVDPHFDGTVDGHADFMYTSFGAALLHGD